MDYELDNTGGFYYTCTLYTLNAGYVSQYTIDWTNILAVCATFTAVLFLVTGLWFP